MTDILLQNQRKSDAAQPSPPFRRGTDVAPILRHLRDLPISPSVERYRPGGVPFRRPNFCHRPAAVLSNLLHLAAPPPGVITVGPEIPIQVETLIRIGPTNTGVRREKLRQLFLILLRYRLPQGMDHIFKFHHMPPPENCSYSALSVALKTGSGPLAYGSDRKSVV